jgi:hypothetical protein
MGLLVKSLVEGIGMAGKDNAGKGIQSAGYLLGLFLGEFVRAPAAEHSVIVFIGHGMTSLSILSPFPNIRAQIQLADPSSGEDSGISDGQSTTAGRLTE